MIRRLLFVGIAVAIVLCAFALALYLFHLNRRLSATLLSKPWRHPIEIMSTRTTDGQPVVRVWGDDWRVTDPVRLADLPPFVPQAFLAAEDVRFYRHPGIDPIGIVRAAWADLRGHGIVQGGSTITQQLVKQKLFSNERTLRRKIPEMLMAVVLTARMLKRDVLEGYLNEIYLGQWGGAPVYGIDEASRILFNKTPERLTPDEAATIAGMVRAPNRQNVDDLLTRRNAILDTMHGRGWLSDDEYEAAASRRLRFRNGSLPDTPFGHYLSAVRTELAGAGVETPPGTRIVCEIDPEMQRAAEEVARNGTAAMRREFPWLRDHRDLQMAILSADPRDGGVRALVGSRDFRIDGYDRTRRMHRQPGSALKPFVYAAALESRRFTTTSILLDEPLEVRLDRHRVWSPRDYDDTFRGPVALRVALEQSLNVPTVRLGESVGLRNVIDELHRFGFEEEMQPVPSLPLGVTAVTLRELVSAYSVFPNLGERAPLHLVREVRNAKGDVVWQAPLGRQRVVDPALAWMVHDLLRGVVIRGTAARLSDDGLGFVAGKTGTTSDYRDAWFVGYTPDLVTGVWVGCDGGAPLRLSAGQAAVPLWSAYTQQISISHDDIRAPDGVVFRDIDPTNGALWEEGCNGPVTESFLAGTEPTARCTEM